MPEPAIRKPDACCEFPLLQQPYALTGPLVVISQCGHDCHRATDYRCVCCQRVPDEIAEYSREQTGEDTSPEDYVYSNEGTLNTESGRFFCTDCYIDNGMPSGHVPSGSTGILAGCPKLGTRNPRPRTLATAAVRSMLDRTAEDWPI